MNKDTNLIIGISVVVLVSVGAYFFFTQTKQPVTMNDQKNLDTTDMPTAYVKRFGPGELDASTAGVMDMIRKEFPKSANGFPDLKDFPADALPPRAIWTEITGEGMYVGFVVEGSGVNFISARCFLADHQKGVTETGTYDPARDGHNNYSYFSPKLCKPIEHTIFPGTYRNSKTDVAIELTSIFGANTFTLKIGDIPTQPFQFKNSIAHVVFDPTPASAQNTKQPVEKDWKPCSATVTIVNNELIHMEVDDEQRCKWIANTVLSGNYSTYGN
jgi:hypothetical protein